MAVVSLKAFYCVSACVALLALVLVHLEPALKDTFPRAHKAVRALKTKAYKVFWRTDPAHYLADGVFSSEMLEAYDGSANSRGVYLAVLGRVYDVQKGAEHYRPGGGYSHFAGRDASRAYITGDFSEAGLSDDLTGVEDDSLLSFKEWVDFYETEYKFVGKLSGRYYTNEGRPTEELKAVLAAIERAKEKRIKDKAAEERFPPCNSEWAQHTGTILWCSKKSGGIERDWVGVPRQYFEPGKPDPRCVCVRNTGPPSDNPTATDHKNRGDLDHPHLKEYPGCVPTSDTCKLGT
ncbi:neuferricin-like [Ornithodoros turicata]|uniref:neuferricin-like n=1 Tax=Ornithodoros turicata TaxID=34597 RepID=UPI0031387E8B